MDSQRRGRLVEGVEVDAVHFLIKKITALLGRPMHTDVADGFFIGRAMWSPHRAAASLVGQRTRLTLKMNR